MTLKKNVENRHTRNKKYKESTTGMICGSNHCSLFNGSYYGTLKYKWKMCYKTSSG